MDKLKHWGEAPESKYHANEILKLRAPDFRSSPFVYVDAQYSYYDESTGWNIVLSRCTGEGHFGRFTEKEVEQGTSRTGWAWGIDEDWKEQ